MSIQSIFIRVGLLLVGYIFGLFQTGYFYGKLVNVNLKEKGSGNTGATNALRVMGLKGALIVFFFDALKAFIPTFVARMIFKGQDLMLVYACYGALGAALGNDFPFFLKFKGGKGVAAIAGFIIALDWRLLIIGVTVFFSIAFITRYVSLASIILAVVMSTAAVIMTCMKWIPIQFTMSTAASVEFLILYIGIFALMVWRHKANIKRLLNGTENRFGKKKEK